MKADTKTLMAVKRYIKKPEGYDMDEVIADMIYETGVLKTKSMGDKSVSPDECFIQWGGELVCSVSYFIDAFSEQFIKGICNILDSFVGDDI